MGHQAPDALGVLSHYDAVIWYTGDDYLTRRPGQPPGTGTARLAVEEMIAVRAFLNEGGKLLYTGKRAGLQYAEGNEFRNFGFPEPDGAPRRRAHRERVRPAVLQQERRGQGPATDAFDTWHEFDENDPTQSDGCIAHNDDFLQYYLGAYIYVSGGNTALETEEGDYLPFNMTGTDAPFEGLTWGFDETGAGNQDHTATFAVTSSLLDPAKYPTFADSRSLASWLRPGAGPFSPFSGQYYMASNAHSGAYKRLGKTVDLTGKTSGDLTFKFSSDLEAGLGLHDGRGARARRRRRSEQRRLDDAARHQRAHDDGDRGQLRRGPGQRLGRPAPVPAALLQHRVRADGRDRHRHVERLHRQLRRAGRTGPSTSRRSRASRSSCSSPT